MNTVYFCETVLDNPSYSGRGVGAFTREVNKNFKNTTNVYDENIHYVVFTHPPPLRNNKDEFEKKTFSLLKTISNANHHKKIIIIYDIIPHLFKDFYKPESDYYDYFEIVKNHFDIVICISNSTKNDLHKHLGFNLDKMTVVYPELSTTFLKTNIENIDIHKKYNITKKYIIAPLGGDMRKNEMKTINSFIKWNNPDYQLVLMYSINETWKNKLLSNVPPEYHKNIIFTNFVPDNDYKYLIKNAKFTIFPSLYEGFGYCVMESVYLGIPVLTSNVGSTQELGLLSPGEILLCNPDDENDIIQKMDFLSKHLNEYECSEKILFNKCYIINNKSFNNLINLDCISDLSYLKPNTTINNCLSKYIANVKNKQNIKIFNNNLSHKVYLDIINLFDINIQVRLSNGGGLSGCVADSCFLNKFILTTNDLYKNIITKDYTNVIVAKTTEMDDWKKIFTGEDSGGYSEKDINNIVNEIFENISNIKSFKPGVNKDCSQRLVEYMEKLIIFLKLKWDSKICFVTPYGSDPSGISDYSYSTIKELSNYVKNIDIYTDCEKIELDKQPANVSFYKIDEIQNNKDNYD